MKPEERQLNSNFVCRIADDVLRDVYVRGKHRDMILPMTVLRRLDAVLESTRGRCHFDSPYQGYPIGYLMVRASQQSRFRTSLSARSRISGRRAGMVAFGVSTGWLDGGPLPASCQTTCPH
jgi:hypothetical protein